MLPPWNREEVMGTPETEIANVVRTWLEWDRERRLARAVRSLLRENAGKPLGVCKPAEQDVLESDPPLAAFFASVAAAGEDAWREEVARVRTRQAARRKERIARTGEWHSGSARLSPVPIIDLLPVWRAWGRMLLNVGPGGRTRDGSLEI
ncbi:hypothetical protein [Azospirillum brasilense]|uniref:hypothetical protein n=1 Tax=Azospirillum brasilense TaxID=192 RepID=UPI00190DD24E|nr:hypothetical protein [Azospirillum brasilense]